MNLAGALWLVALAILECCWRTYSSNVPKELLAEMETNLISLFGFKQRPKIDKSKVVIPQAMLDLYQKQMGFPLDTASIPKKGWHTRSANTVRSFTHIESPIDERFTTHHKFRLKFDIKTVPKEETVKAAELILNRNKIDWLSGQKDKDHYQKVLVHAILKPGKKGKHGPFTTVIDSKMVDTRKNTSLSFDVLPAVEMWLDDPKSNHGILITILGVGKNKTTPAHHLRLRRSLDENQMTWNNVQPLLLTYTDDGKNVQKTGYDMTTMQRRRRATKKHPGRRREEKREPCSRHKMYVDFTDVGWNDWIVAPPGYDAYYCHGECNFPLAEHLNTTNHAIVQTLMNSVNPTKVPKSCCVPTSLNSVSMLYLDDQAKVVLKNYKEMTVIGCGCR